MPGPDLAALIKMHAPTVAPSALNAIVAAFNAAPPGNDAPPADTSTPDTSSVVDTTAIAKEFGEAIEANISTLRAELIESLRPLVAEQMTVTEEVSSMAFSTDEESQLRSLLTARQAQQQEEVAREKKFEEINAKPVEAISAEDREFLRQYVLVGLQDLYK